MAAVRANGTELFHREKGTGGSPVLLIHGAAGSADIWQGTVDELARDLRVVAYDRRGYRHSSGPAVADYHVHGEDAAALLRELRIAPACLVGWSGGGLIALDVVVHHADLVQSVVLVEPPLHARRHMTLQMAITFANVEFLRRVRGRRGAAVETFLRWATSRTSGGCAFESMPQAMQEAMLDTADATLADLDAGTGEELSMKQVASIRCPVTCLLGTLTAPAIARATRRIVRALPRARLVLVEGASHAIHFDRPDAFVDAIRNHLSEAPAAWREQVLERPAQHLG
jgi:pimeloyl-ACP methyl ester carboxylesterase